MSSGSEWYAEYLKSDHWRRLRERKLIRAEYRCQKCGEEALMYEGGCYNLQVHHLTYERCPNNELFSDLEVLCQACHQAEHFDNPISHEDMRMWARRRISDQFIKDYSYVDEVDLEIKAWDDLAEAAGL